MIPYIVSAWPASLSNDQGLLHQKQCFWSELPINSLHEFCKVVRGPLPVYWSSLYL